MSCGKPVIARLWRVADILLKSEVALIIPLENPEDLIKAIKVLKSDAEKRGIMGQKGRAFVENNFDRKIFA